MITLLIGTLTHTHTDDTFMKSTESRKKKKSIETMGKTRLLVVISAFKYMHMYAILFTGNENEHKS